MSDHKVAYNEFNQQLFGNDIKKQKGIRHLFRIPQSKNIVYFPSKSIIDHMILKCLSPEPSIILDSALKGVKTEKPLLRLNIICSLH